MERSIVNLDSFDGNPLPPVDDHPTQELLKESIQELKISNQNLRKQTEESRLKNEKILQEISDY